MSQGQPGSGGFNNFTASLLSMMNRRHSQEGQATQKQVCYVNGRRYTIHQTRLPTQQQQYQYQYLMQPTGQPVQMTGTGMMEQNPQGYQMQQGQQGMGMQPSMGMQQTGYRMQNTGMQSVEPQQGYQQQFSTHGRAASTPLNFALPQGTMQAGYQGQPIQNQQMMAMAPSAGQQMEMMQEGYPGQPMQTPQMVPMQNMQRQGMMQTGQPEQQMQTPQMMFMQNPQALGMMQNTQTRQLMQTPQMMPMHNIQTPGMMQTGQIAQPGQQMQTPQMMAMQTVQTAGMSPRTQLGQLDQSAVFYQTGSQISAGEPGLAHTLSATQQAISTSIVNAAASLEPGDLFGNRYMIEGPVAYKPNNHYGIDKFSGKKVVLVWCTPGEALNNFIQFHYNTKQKFKGICKLMDVEQEEGYLPCLIFERGDVTLEEWISKNSDYDPMSILVQIATALQTLHTANYVHGCLDPSQIVMFTEKKKYKMLITNPYQTGSAAPMHPSMLYCAPESVRAQLQGQTVMADACIDMFSFGALAFRLITGQPLYGLNATVDTILNHLQSWSPFPVDSAQGFSLELLENLLSYDTRLRWTASKVLSSEAFSTALSVQEGREMMQSESQKLAQTMNEMRLGGVVVSVGVEYFTSGSNPAYPYYQREARMVDTMKDDYLKNEPIFITRVNENYRFRINLTNEKHQALPIKKINYIRTAAPDGCTIYLQTAQSLVTARTQEVLCFFDPARCHSMKLENVGEQYGGLMDKYVKVDITVGVTMAGSTEQDMELNEHIFLLRIPNSGGTMVQDCKEYFSKRWESLPQWQRNAAKIASKMGLKPMMKMTKAAFGVL